MDIVELVLFSLLILLLLLVAYLLWRQAAFRSDVISVVLQSDRLNTYFYSLFSDAKKIMEEQKADLKAEILAELRDAIRQKEPAQKPVSQASGLLEPLQSLPLQPQQKLLYASVASQVALAFYKVTETPDADTVFVLALTDPEETQAEFEIYPEVYSKVMKQQNFLEIACDVQNSGVKAVQMEAKGTAQKQADGRWKITRPAKIKFV